MIATFHNLNKRCFIWVVIWIELSEQTIFPLDVHVDLFDKAAVILLIKAETVSSCWTLQPFYTDMDHQDVNLLFYVSIHFFFLIVGKDSYFSTFAIISNSTLFANHVPVGWYSAFTLISPGNDSTTPRHLPFSLRCDRWRLSLWKAA